MPFGHTEDRWEAEVETSKGKKEMHVSALSKRQFYDAMCPPLAPLRRWHLTLTLTLFGKVRAR